MRYMQSCLTSESALFVSAHSYVSFRFVCVRLDKVVKETVNTSSFFFSAHATVGGVIGGKRAEPCEPRKRRSCDNLAATTSRPSSSSPQLHHTRTTFNTTTRRLANMADYNMEGTPAPEENLEGSKKISFRFCREW